LKGSNTVLSIRRSKERGHADHGWLDSHNTFSFANYYDPAQMGFHSLRVINEDRVAPGRGFGGHAHRDMEILSYVLQGQLAHKDNMGHTEILGPNEIQRMSAGRGVTHSEFNASATEPVHFLQIWIEPKTNGTNPSYEQLKFEPEEKLNQWKLLASDKTVAGAATINQDAAVSVAELDPGSEISYPLDAKRHAWLHVIRGKVNVNGSVLSVGDAAAIEQEKSIEIVADDNGRSEILLFDLA
jgi:redox-sensitive bicupin YhaK (pirin superfamily)